MSDTVIKWNVSFIDRNGLRTLLGPAQGRHMLETREAAEQWLAAVLGESEEKLVGVCGEQSRGTFRVAAFKCWAGHGDPVGIFVQEGLT